MWNLDPFNIAIHWVILTFFFLFMTYLFRGYVMIDGFWGGVLLLFLVIPLNVFAGASGHLAALSEMHPFLFACGLIAANAILLSLWCRCLHGLEASGFASLLLFGALFSLFAFGLQLAPAIPLGEVFPAAMANN